MLLLLLCNVETTIRCKNVIMNCTMCGCCIRWRKQPTTLKREDTPGNWMSLVVSVLVQFGLYLYWKVKVCIGQTGTIFFFLTTQSSVCCFYSFSTSIYLTPFLCSLLFSVVCLFVLLDINCVNTNWNIWNKISKQPLNVLGPRIFYCGI